MSNWFTEQFKVEEKMEYRKWVKEIPFLKFKDDWLIQCIPPFGRALTRFRVTTEKLKDEFFVSIYLDCYENLGSYGSPYWEVYPHNDDVFRCGIDETEILINAIQEALDNYEQNIPK